LAYYDVWKHEDGTWQKGIKPDSSAAQTYTITESVVPDGAKIISVKGEFNYGYSDEYWTWAVPTGSVNGVSYEIANEQTKNGALADLTYTVSTTLTTNNNGIYGRNIKQPWQSANVEGYRYYIPAHFEITYEITEPVPEPPAPEEITAVIEAPASAKTGESFNVADGTLVGEETVLASSTLYKSVDGGTKQLVAEWEGTGNKGENTGGSISETYDTPCKIEYELVAETESGLTDTATKTVTITDGREIDGDADLVLDKYTYEGHPADAKDETTFTVDGESYSAKRAYEEGIARNSYRAQDGTVKKDGYNAIVTFPKKGIYPVTLNVTVKSTGAKLTDTENIEVRKTPYVEDSLGGFQKQNRKQVLNFDIATYPDKPITDWKIHIRDKKTGELATLTADNPKFVGESIKTREAQVTVKDKYWTNITVEFLTKYPDYDDTGEDTRDFYYDISVTDSKGDSDNKNKEFEVAPDLPPFAKISMQTSFLREKESNIAKLEAEDISSSDGDQLERTWSVANHDPKTDLAAGQTSEGGIIPNSSFTNVTMFDGYKNMAFGTNQKIGWNKEGVGKFSLKLHVKDVWTEPTLEEYITADDYLEAECIETSQVLNIAPVVSIEPIFFDYIEIVLLAEKNNISELKNQTNEMKRMLLEEQIDADINCVKTVTPNDYGFKKWGNVTFESGNGAIESYASDANNIYYLETNGTYVSGSWKYAEDDYTIHAVGIDEENDSVKENWSYYVGAVGSQCYLQTDSADKYLYFTANGKTTLLNSLTGAYVTELPLVLPNTKYYMSSDESRIYYVDNGSIKKYDFNAGSQNTVMTGVSGAQYVEGGLTYITQLSEYKFVLNKLDFKDESVTSLDIPELEAIPWGGNEVNYEYIKGSVQVCDFDTEGNALFSQRVTDDEGEGLYVYYWTASSKKGESQRFQRTTQSVSYDMRGLTAQYIKDECGKAKAILLYELQHTSVSSRKDYYMTLAVQALDDNGTASDPKNITAYETNSRQSMSFYTTYNSMEKRFYIIQASEFNEGENFGGNVTGLFYVLDDNLNVKSNSRSAYGLDNNDETFFSNNHMTLSKLLYDAYKSRYAAAGIFTNSIDEETAKEQSLIFNVRDRGITAEIKEFISSIQDLSITELVEKVRNAIENRKTLKVKVNGTSGTVSKKFNLDLNREYFVEYKVKADNAVAETMKAKIELKYKDVNGNNLDKLSFEDGDYIVTEEHIENFADKNIESFFTCSSVPSNGKFNGTTTFTVPEGKKALLVFDYETYINLGDYADELGPNCCSYIIDGQYWEKTIMTAGTTKGTYTHPYILEEGTHTLASRYGHPESGNGSSNFSWGEGAINYYDNLKVIFVEEAEGDITEDKYEGEPEETESGGWTLGKLSVSPKINLAYTASDMEHVKTDYKNEPNIESPLVSKSYSSEYGKGAYEKIVISIPEDKTSLLTKVDTRLSWYQTRCMTSVTYAGHYTLKTVVYSTGSSKNRKYYADTGCIPNPYTIRENNMTGTNTFSTSRTTNNDNYARTAYLDGAELNLIPTENMNAAFQSGEYFLDEEQDKAYYLNGSCDTASPVTVTLEFTNKTEGIGEFFLEDLKIYYIENGKKVYVDLNSASSDGIEGWTLSDNVTAEGELIKKAEKEETSIVYKKGELVDYSINYSDYENDPSKASQGYSYWVYAHEPFNDGEHPQAAIIYDEDGNIIKICGKTVEEAISAAGIELESAESLSMDKAIEA
ncbi:MAG: hypothetical protein ACI4LO_01405, partial [Anaerovoracaceae bacterium]